MKLYNNSLTSLISLTIGSLKLTLPQILRYFDYGLMFYFIFASIMALVGICASLVECLSVLPYGFAGFYDSVLQINNRGNPENSGFLNPNPGTPNTPSGPGRYSAGGTDEIAKSMVGVDIDLAKIYDSILSKIVNYLNYIFEPVQHSFTIDIM
jgi:hypothetical protein